MNDLTKERVAEKMLAAIKNEDLMNIEAAEIIGISSNYLSSIKRSDTYHRVPSGAWEKMKAFTDSGKTLKAFGKPEITDKPTPQEDNAMFPNIKEDYRGEFKSEPVMKVDNEEEQHKTDADALPEKKQPESKLSLTIPKKPNLTVSVEVFDDCFQLTIGR